MGKQFDRVADSRDPLRRRGPARQRAGRSGFGVGGTRRRPGQAGQRNLTTRRWRAPARQRGLGKRPPASTHSPSRPAVFRPAPGSWPGARVRRPRNLLSWPVELGSWTGAWSSSPPALGDTPGAPPRTRRVSDFSDGLDTYANGAGQFAGGLKQYRDQLAGFQTMTVEQLSQAVPCPAELHWGLARPSMPGCRQVRALRCRSSRRRPLEQDPARAALQRAGIGVRGRQAGGRWRQAGGRCGAAQ